MDIFGFNNLVKKLMNEGKNPLEVASIAEKTGLFDKQIVDEFWNGINKIRERQ